MPFNPLATEKHVNALLFFELLIMFKHSIYCTFVAYLCHYWVFGR